MYAMKVTTATAFRKQLFKTLEQATRAIPTRIRYKKRDAVLLSYGQYQLLQQRPKRTRDARPGLRPLVEGKILAPLDVRSDDAVMAYMGL